MNDNAILHLLDVIGWRIISELQQNARIPFAELGRRVGLSSPAVAERIRRLEEEGVIGGYHAEVDPEKIGYRLLAFVRVNVVGDVIPKFVSNAARCPEVLEVHRVTGSESFILKVAVVDHAHLEVVLDSLMPYVSTTTSMVLSSAVRWRPLERPSVSASKS